MYDNFKRLMSDDAFYYALLITLVAIASFGLGRWSVAQNKPITPISAPAMVVRDSERPQAGIQVKKAAPSVPEEEEVKAAEELQYVASKSGTKYHLLWCPGAKSIKEENKIFFGSKEEAERAGYTPAANCKGI